MLVMDITVIRGNLRT